MPVVVAIDAGTTGVRAFAIGDDGLPRGRSYREFTQHFPQPGWVEHDADEIWKVTQETLARAVVEPRRADRGHRHHRPARDDRGLGSTHRPAAAPSDRVAGPAHGRALRRAARRRAPRPRAVAHRPGARPLLLGHEARVAHPTGRSSTSADLAFGTVDSWLLWNLTGGAVHATDLSNASRTMLFDIARARLVGRAARPVLGASLDAARGAAVERTVRRDGRRHRRGRGHPDHAASPATSRRRCSARPASRRA